MVSKSWWALTQHWGPEIRQKVPRKETNKWSQRHSNKTHSEALCLKSCRSIWSDRQSGTTDSIIKDGPSTTRSTETGLGRRHPSRFSPTVGEKVRVNQEYWNPTLQANNHSRGCSQSRHQYAGHICSSHLLITSVYVRFKNKNGDFSCQLVFARSRVIPKGMIQPRGELYAALTNAYTGEVVKRSFKKFHKQAIKFTDSQITLFWISNDEKHLKQWTRNRVIEI